MPTPPTLSIVCKVQYGKAVRVEPETRYHAPARSGKERKAAFGFAGIDIGYMHFDDGCFYSCHGVGYCHRGVGVAAGVEHYAGGRKTVLLYAVDYFALDVGLEIDYLRIGKCSAQGCQIAVEIAVAVFLRLASAEQIKVRVALMITIFIAVIVC